MPPVHSQKRHRTPWAARPHGRTLLLAASLAVSTACSVHAPKQEPAPAPQPSADTAPSPNADPEILGAEQTLARHADFALDQEVATQQALAVQQRLQHYQRLHRVAYPVLQAGAPLCPKTTLGHGMLLINRQAIQTELRPLAVDRLGLDAHLQVLALAPNSPAAHAGLRDGDRILSLNGVAAPQGAAAIAAFQRVFKQRAAEHAVLRMEVVRDQIRHTVELRAQGICDYGFGLLQSHRLNAYADGANVYITAGMIDFARQDYELAFVFAHELAHNILGHAEKVPNEPAHTHRPALLAPADNGKGPLQRYHKEYEEAADYLGLYAVALAGHRVEQVPYFWRRVAARLPQLIAPDPASSHPASSARFVVLQSGVQEILAKRASGQPLQPRLPQR